MERFSLVLQLNACRLVIHLQTKRNAILTQNKYPDIAPLLRSNPMGGFLPIILLLLLLPYTGMVVAWTAGAALLLVLRAILLFRGGGCHPAMITALAVLALLLPTFWLPQPTPFAHVAWSVVAILLVVAVSRLFYGRKSVEDDYRGCPHRRLVLLEYNRILRTVLRIALFTLVLMGAYLYLQVETRWGMAVARWLLHFPALLLLVLYGYEVIRLEWVRRKMLEEEWIPITDAKGESIGRIARSEHEKTAPPTGLLPVVRLIAISDGMIYLSHYCECDLCTGDCYDTPFFSWLTIDREHGEMAQSLIDERFCGIKRLQPRFLLRYVHNDNGEDRLVYLYLAHMSAPDMILGDKDPRQGKWWPVDQIEEQLSGLTFSPYLRSEMPYLRQTVLLAERLKNHHE